MSNESNQAPELNRADTSEARMTGDDRFAKVPVRLHELLERGEISPEEFALYTEGADQVRAGPAPLARPVCHRGEGRLAAQGAARSRGAVGASSWGAGGCGEAADRAGTPVVPKPRAHGRIPEDRGRWTKAFSC
jgi:hypothetical protein